MKTSRKRGRCGFNGFAGEWITSRKSDRPAGKLGRWEAGTRSRMRNDREEPRAASGEARWAGDGGGRWGGSRGAAESVAVGGQEVGIREVAKYASVIRLSNLQAPRQESRVQRQTMDGGPLRDAGQEPGTPGGQGGNGQ